MYSLVSFIKATLSASFSFFLSHSEEVEAKRLHRGSPRLLFVITPRSYLIPLFSHCFPSFLSLLPLRPHTQMVARTRARCLPFRCSTFRPERFPPSEQEWVGHSAAHPANAHTHTHTHTAHSFDRV